MKFLSGLLETKGEEEVRHSMAGRSHTFEGMPYKVGWSTERAVREGIERSSIVFKCVDTIATSGSRLPTVVREGGREPQHEIIKKHPLSLFFGGMVNEFETGQHFLYRLIALFLLSKQGVAVEYLRNRSGKIAGLYILPPDQTYPVPGRGKFVDHWRIEASDGEVYELPPEDVLWVRKPHPTDPYASLTPMEAAGVSIDVDFYARLFNRDFMLSDGRPTGLVSVHGVRDNDVDELNRRFRGSGAVRKAVGSGMTTHGGSAGEISVVESDKIDFVDLHTSQRDAQYVESMGITKDDIMLAFGTPESVMGNASGRTFDNADAEKEVFWEATMLPTLDLVYSALDILTGAIDDDEFLCADTSSVDVLQRAQREREDRLQAQFDKGLINVDEYREETGRDPQSRPGSRVLFIPGSGKIAVGAEADEKAVAEMTVLGSPEEAEEGAGPGGMVQPNGRGAAARSTRRTQPTADRGGTEVKHAKHNQKDHGNWVKGPRAIDIRDDHAIMNMIDRFEIRDGAERLGTIHRHGDEDGPWVARRVDGSTTEHGSDKDAAIAALRESGPGVDPAAGDPFHPSFLEPGDTFEVEGDSRGPWTLELAWIHRQGDTSLRVQDGVVKLPDAARVRLVDPDEAKHMGPGPHPSGTPQAIHASGVTFAPDGRGGMFEVVKREPVDFLAKALPDSGFDYHDVMADPERGKRIRAAYADLPSEADGADLAFDAMAAEVDDQYRMLTEDLGVDVQVVDSDPYADVDELMADLRENKTLKVLSTASTGSHPYFSDETNDRFRAVHDAFGHAGTGRGFDRHGEEAAWVAHSRMFSPLAARAMTTETRGQNSAMVWGGGGFPEQKVALLPDWAMDVDLSGTKAMTAADRDNLYHVSGIHHASNGRWKAGVETKHLGPGPHPSGTPQSVHGSITPTGIAKRTVREGGLTVRLGANLYPDGGFAVAVHPEATRIFSVEEFKRDATEHVRQYVADNDDLLSLDERFLGTWLDTETAKVYLDVSIVLPDKDAAMRVAKDHGEKAIFDFETMEDIPVPDEVPA